MVRIFSTHCKLIACESTHIITDKPKRNSATVFFTAHVEKGSNNALVKYF